MTSLPSLADDAHSETTPLLDASQPDSDSSSQSTSSWTPKKWRVMIIGSIILLAMEFGISVSAPPEIKIFEDIICRNYYANLNQTTALPLDDAICKTAPVQSELALVNGWKSTFDVLPSILFGLPYGVLADHIGRKPVLIMSVMGSVVGETWSRIVCWSGMPLRLVWLSGLFRAFGGGDQVIVSMFMVLVADLFSEAERATALFRLSAATVVAEIVGTPIAAAMMSRGPWLPYLIGLALYFISFPLLLVVPESIEEAREKSRKTLVAQGEDVPEELEPPSKSSVFGTIHSRIQEFIQSTQFIWRNTNVLLSLLVLFVSNLSKQSTNLFLQYASAKYHWSIARASFLISLRGAISIATILLLVRVVSSFLTRRFHLDAVRKDVYVAQGSAAVTIVGFFLISVAPNPVVLIMGVVLVSLGVPFVVAVLSVATSLVLPDHVATLYSAVSMMRGVGILVAGPMFAGLYAFGMRLGLLWSGLPFAAASLIFCLALIAFSCVRIERRPGSVAGVD